MSAIQSSLPCAAKCEVVTNQEHAQEEFSEIRHSMRMMSIDKYFIKSSTVASEHKKIQVCSAQKEKVEKHYRQTQLPVVTVLLPDGKKRILFKMPYPSNKKTLPTVTELIREYKTRTWSSEINFVSVFGVTEVAGYLPRGQNAEERAQFHEADRNLLLEIMKVHNEQWSQFIDTIDTTGAGAIQRVLVKDKEHLYVRADLHSDLATLIKLLDLFRAEGYLDESYHCKNDFKIFLLGDYADRGVNDIEILSLLLTFLRENPSVVLLRGNHEDVLTHKDYSDEAHWIEQHASEFTRCYSSFPSAVCIAEEGGVCDKDGRREYTHCSHAGCNPSVDLDPLFEGSAQYVVIKQIQEMSNRFLFLKQSGSEKQVEAFTALEKHIPERGRSASGYVWNDAGPRSRPSKRGLVGTYEMSSEDLHFYAQIASTRGKIKQYLRGHQHSGEEFLIPSKAGKGGIAGRVYVTTLSVGTTVGSFYRNTVGLMREQGLLLKVAPRVRDWKKIVVCMDEKGSAYLDPIIRGMYEPLYTHY